MLKSNKKILSKHGRNIAVYFDNASATPIEGAVLRKMNDVFKKNYANSSSLHALGVESRKILEKSRAEIAQVLSAHKDEIIFTSGATESNNLAILGFLEKFPENNIQFILPHIVTTNIEHPSVLEVFKYLEKTKKAEVTYIPVENNGIVDSKKIRNSLKENTVLVSVMYANNEIGTIQSIIEIAKEIRHFKKIKSSDKFLPVFHTDAAQATNYLEMNVEKLGVDLMSINGGKIYGPKGVGALYIKRNTKIKKILYGGNQEFDLRPGTENLANIVGFTEALKITEKIKLKENKRLTILRDYFIDELCNSESLKNYKITVNGDIKNRLPNNINISIPKIPSDLILIELSARGIYVSEKSACKSGDKEGSHVLKAINNPKLCKKNNSIRFSMGRQTKKEDIDYTLKSLVEILKKLKKWY